MTSVVYKNLGIYHSPILESETKKRNKYEHLSTLRVFSSDENEKKKRKNSDTFIFKVVISVGDHQNLKYMDGATPLKVTYCDGYGNFSPNAEEIILGYMSISKYKWKPDWKDDGEGRKDEDECDPNEIVIAEKKITICYDYPLKEKFYFTHEINSEGGFSRKEISIQIMDRYRKIYEEEKKAVDDPGVFHPGFVNRNKSNGPYGIDLHYIEDLQLHTLYRLEDGTNRIGIDS